MKLTLALMLICSLALSACNRKTQSSPGESSTGAPAAAPADFKSANPFDPLAPETVKAKSNYNNPESKGSKVAPPDVWKDVESDEDDLINY